MAGERACGTIRKTREQLRELVKEAPQERARENQSEALEESQSEIQKETRKGTLKDESLRGVLKLDRIQLQRDPQSLLERTQFLLLS